MRALTNTPPGKERIMRDFRDAKAMAKAMRTSLAARQIDITHTQALEIVAQQLGEPNWNVLSAKIERSAATPDGDAVAFEQAVPIIRIFDVAKAHEFYLGFLGFSLDWEHRLGEDYPLYTQISRDGLRLHLSEHAGDATPGSNVCVFMHNIAALHREFTDKQYRYMKPQLIDQGTRLELQVTDPFSNRIRFTELKPG